MTTTINAKNLTLAEVHRLFGFQKQYTNSFTPLLSLEDITEHEQQELIQIRDDFDDYISTDRVSEGSIGIRAVLVLAPQGPGRPESNRGGV